MSTMGGDVGSSSSFFNCSNITDWIGEAVFHRRSKIIRLQTACFGFTGLLSSGEGVEYSSPVPIPDIRKPHFWSGGWGKDSVY